MISTQENNIKVWNFTNGKINLITTLQGHTDNVSCLIYSKKINSFISGDKTMRCWKKEKQNEWKSSKPYLQHTNIIICFILNYSFLEVEINQLKYGKLILIKMNQLIYIHCRNIIIVLQEQVQINQKFYQYLVQMIRIKLLFEKEDNKISLNSNLLLNSQSKQKDKKQILLERINLFGLVLLKKQINYMYLNQKKATFKKIRRKHFNQLQIIKNLMIIDFQLFLIQQGILSQNIHLFD
ncbi:unnamed protein product [Paramecium sonneborni]|uniref:Uncharacterized protein n=1 Tax=Paramecium sonneborni TaxID=65129 RepID=A0A8S1RKL8_9CILI|nr:unnamed protein product [Paramecium sonneborni]